MADPFSPGVIARLPAVRDLDGPITPQRCSSTMFYEVLINSQHWRLPCPNFVRTIERESGTTEKVKYEIPLYVVGWIPILTDYDT